MLDPRRRGSVLKTLLWCHEGRVGLFYSASKCFSYPLLKVVCLSSRGLRLAELSNLGASRAELYLLLTQRKQKVELPHSL